MPRDLSSEFLVLHEFIAAARDRLDANAWDYLIGGTETETTLARNRAALDTIAFCPRMLVDVSEIDVSAEFLGHPVRMPVLLAPVGGLEYFDPEGAVAAAQAAGAYGVPVMASSVSPRTKPELRAATDGPAMFQLYVNRPGRFLEEQVEATIEAGLDAFCVTVDVAVYSRRERDTVKRFVKPWRQAPAPEAERAQAALNWRDIERIRKAYDIPLMIKGIMTAEDARIAADLGVDAICVSNHGGRQLDHALGAMDVLPEIVAAVGGRMKLIVDGGFCRGTDIVKAMAMGADAVGLGRLYCYALAAAGSQGVVRMLEILEDEVMRAMGLLGVARFADLTPDHIRRGAPLVTAAHVHSAFPLLE